MDDIIKNIQIAWDSIRKNLSDEQINMSSEKTLVFLFSIELIRIYGWDNLIIDFEYLAYNELHSSDKYLDLMVYKKDKIEKKYALEFKFPKKSSRGNSNQTETRKKVYRDIARLKYLKEQNKIEYGFFLMLCNEKAYVNSSDRRNNDYDISHNKEGNLLIYKSKYRLNDDISFKFIWKEESDYFILEPIII